MQKKWLFRILSAIGSFLSSLFSAKADDAEVEEAAKEIDKADDHIKVEPLDPINPTDEDAFNNEDWNNRNRTSK